MSGGASIDGGGVLAPLERQLEAEQERWFCWLPVFLGCGIGAYFGLPVEPSLVIALVPLVVMFAWRGARTGRGTLGSLLVAALMAATFGFALAKLRVEWVRAPVLERQINSAEVRGWVEQVEPKAGGGSGSPSVSWRWANCRRRRGRRGCASHSRAQRRRLRQAAR